MVPGFRGHGLWSVGEVAVLQRAQAALGAALSGLERAPWLLDATRAQALAWTGDAAAIRLVGAVAVAALVGLAVWLARRLGASPGYALLAGGFVLVFPVQQSHARLAVGNPVGELVATLAVVLGVLAIAAAGRARAVILAVACVLALILGLLGAGLLAGVVLPLLVMLLAWPHGLAEPGTAPSLTRRRWLWLVLVVGGFLASAGWLLWLAVGQGEGWIAALAAARDLAVAERPHARAFTATLEEFSDQVFPWAPLVLVGLLTPGRARWLAHWLVVGLLVVSVWSLRYGPQLLPLAVPAAVLCAAGVESLLAQQTPAATRRLGLLIAVVGFFVLARDAQRSPHRVGAVAVVSGARSYPGDELAAGKTLAGLARWATAGLVLAVGVGVVVRRPRPPGSRLARLSPPQWLPLVPLVAVLGHQVWRYSYDLLPRTSQQWSLHHPLQRLAGWQAAGDLPEALGIYRVGDPGVDLYGPPATHRQVLTGRDAAIRWLQNPDPAAVLMRRSELPVLYQHSRAGGWPLHVIDASNRDVLLVANRLPPGATDENPLIEIVHTEPPALANETLVRFEEFVEVVGWSWHAPVVRGRTTTLELALRVLRPLPSSTKVYVRLQRGRMSRINPMPHELTNGMYPVQYWRAGDVILHRFTVDVPLLEILSGPHDVVLGLRRTETRNFKISVPEGEAGPGVVEVHGNREFAKLGTVQVW